MDGFSIFARKWLFILEKFWTLSSWTSSYKDFLYLLWFRHTELRKHYLKLSQIQEIVGGTSRTYASLCLLGNSVAIFFTFKRFFSVFLFFFFDCHLLILDVCDYISTNFFVHCECDQFFDSLIRSLIFLSQDIYLLPIILVHIFICSSVSQWHFLNSSVP